MLLNANALDAFPLADGSVHMCVTSPPYHNLRDYGIEGQLGLEETVEEYVENMVQVFRNVWRVLRDDGVAFLNLGDSYSSDPNKGGSGTPNGRNNRGENYGRGMSGAVRPDVSNCFQRLVKGQPLIFGNAATIAITGQGGDVSLHDNGFPYRVLLSLLGVERITIKQRNNNFSQILHTFANPSYCWIDCPVAFAAMNSANLEIVLDAVDSVRVVITHHNANSKPVLGVKRVGGRSRKTNDTAFAVEETSKPVTEWIASGQSFGHPVTFDAPLERFPDVYFVDQSVALGNRLDAPAGDLRDFCVTAASQEKVTFALGNFGVDLTAIDVAHLFIPNSFGSLVRYPELYDKANRKANATQAKQELGIPDLVKRALMEDGWICRSTIIWHKPNPMPESTLDRCTKSHEYLFMLAKRPRYYFDNEAIKEPGAESSTERLAQDVAHQDGSTRANGGAKTNGNMKAVGNGSTRNKRSVWTIPTQSFAGAHFATFPPALVEPCILAGSSPQVCSVCGAPWARCVERQSFGKAFSATKYDDTQQAGPLSRSRQAYRAAGLEGPPPVVTTGWAATCAHADAPTVPAIVLDPFAGSGTTGAVARQHGRRFVGLDLNAVYLRDLALPRAEGKQTAQSIATLPLFAAVQP